MLVLGASFVARLKECPNLFLSVRGKKVHLSGFSGRTSRWLRESLEGGSIHLPLGCQVVMLVIGSNDLCDVNCSPEQVVESILDLARLLLSAFGITKVIVSEILPRTKRHPRYMSGLTLEEYNAKVWHTNALLQNRCHSGVFISFWWHHHSCVGSWRICHDGVHLHEQYGLPGFNRSLYYALKSNTSYF